MNKVLLSFLAAVLLSPAAQAQIYNKTYSQTKPDFRAADFISANSNGESVMLSRDRYYGSGTEKELVLTKFNALGGIIDEKWWDMDYLSYTMRPDKLVQTPDNGYLVVGRTIVSGNVFAAKFDMNLNFQWAKEYIFSSGSWNQGRNPKALVTKIQSSPTDYMLVSNGSPVQGNSGDASILAFRINGLTGNLVWKFKYEIPWTSRNVAPQDYYLSLNNRPYALANGGGKSFIAGELDFSAYFTLGYDGFYLAIADNGDLNTGYNIIDNYASSGHYAIYDDRANGSANPPSSAFILSYTAALTGGLRQVAIQKFSVFPTAVPGLLDYYYENGVQEIYPKGIARKLGDDFYTVSVWRRPNEMLGAGALGMMSINKNRTTGAFKVYNEMTTAAQEATAPVSLVSGATEKNVMIGRKAPGIRVISADLNLDACGSAAKVLLTTAATTPFIPLPYAKHEFGGLIQGFNFVPGYIRQDNNDCSDLPASDWPFYRVIAPDQAVTGQQVRVYPTLIGKEQQIRIDVSAIKETVLEASLFAVDGKRIRQQSFELTEGSQTLSLDLPELASGTYIIRLLSSDAQISRSIRLSKL